MNADAKKEFIKELFRKILDSDETLIIDSIIEADAYGHLAGTPIEEWVRLKLLDWNIKTLYPNIFIKKFFDKIGPDKVRLKKFREEIWWGKLLISNKQIYDYCAGRTVMRWQQEGADLIFVEQENFTATPEDIVLINVKSHNNTRRSRPPNILSGQRLLELLSHNVQRNQGTLDSMNYWFIGVAYTPTDDGAIVKGVWVKDLFKLDVEKIPQINFDAAIQIQWHVEDMIEKDQTRKQFAKELALKFMEQWTHHSNYKTEKYRRLTENILKSIT